MTFPPPVMPDPDRASRAIIPYFSDALRGRESGIHVAWMLAFASMTAGGGVKGSGFFHRWGLLVFLKSGIHVAWILAFARMTIGDASASGTPLYRHPLSLARGSRAKSPYFGGALRVGKAEFMLPGCSLSQA